MGRLLAPQGSLISALVLLRPLWGAASPTAPQSLPYSLLLGAPQRPLSLPYSPMLELLPLWGRPHSALLSAL